MGQAQPGCGVSGQGGRIGRAHRPGLCSRPAGRSRPLGGATAFLRGLREGAWVPSEPLWDTNDAGFPRRDVPIPFICNKRNERNVCRPLMYLSNRKVIPACDGGGGHSAFMDLPLRVLVPRESLGLAGVAQKGGTVPAGSSEAWDWHGRCQACGVIPGGRWPRARGRVWEGGLRFRRGSTGSPLWVDNREVLERASSEFLTRRRNGSKHKSLFHVPLMVSSTVRLRGGGV